MVDPNSARQEPLEGSGDGSRDRIRVLQFSSVVNRDDFIDTIARHGDPERFELAVCSYRSSHIRDPEYEEVGIRHFILPEPRSRWVHPGVIRNLARVIESWRPDVVHAHHFYESVEAVLAARLASTRVATIYGRHFADEFYISLRGVNRRLHLALDTKSFKAEWQSWFIETYLIHYWEIPCTRWQIGGNPWFEPIVNGLGLAHSLAPAMKSTVPIFSKREVMTES